MGVEYNMVTVKDFKKLSRLENQGYHIYVDGEEVCGLMYDEDLDWTEFVDACEEMRCSFTFVLDRYTIVQGLKEHQNAKWTVEQHTLVDWHKMDNFCYCGTDEYVDWDGFGGGRCRKCNGDTF